MYKLLTKFIVLFCLLNTSFLTAVAGEIIQITAATRHLIPKGKKVDAIDGDWILKNDKVVVVIAGAAPDQKANRIVQGIQGAVLDFTSLTANNNQLVAYYPQDYRLDGISTDKIEAVKAHGKEIILKCTRHSTVEEPYQSETVYTLREGEKFLRIKTTHSNTGKNAVSFYLADKIKLDNDIIDISLRGNNNLSFIYKKY